MWLVYTQIVPVIFEPPCNTANTNSVTFLLHSLKLRSCWQLNTLRVFLNTNTKYSHDKIYNYFFKSLSRFFNLYIEKSCFIRIQNGRKNLTFQYILGSRDSSVGIATRYGLEGPGIESRWRRNFPHHSRPATRPTQPPVQWVKGLSRGQSGRGVVLTTHPHLVPRYTEGSRAIPLLSPKRH